MHLLGYTSDLLHRAVLWTLPAAMAWSMAASLSADEVVPPADESLPNIIVILADDLGYGSLGCYGANSELLETPHLDQLAREGVRLTDACTPASICSPTRYAILTGRYCWRTQLKHGIVRMHDPLLIETDRPTIASVLKHSGYSTAAIGKWHLGYSDRSVNFTERLDPGPLEIGFDYHFGIASNHGDGSGVFIENYGIYGLRGKSIQHFGTQYYGDRPYMGLDAPQRTDEDVPMELLARVTSWLDRQQGPFFLYYAPVEPHVPVTPSRSVAGTSKAGSYGDWIHELDRNVGHLLEYLERRDLTDNTLVIVTSDNGGEDKPTRYHENRRAIEAGLAINGPWRAGKHSIYEGGFRVPFIARWPRRIKAGTTSDAAFNLVDLPATLTAAAGATAPNCMSGFEDSVDQLPVLLGQTSRERIFQVLQSADGVLAVREGRWKWIEGVPANADSAQSQFAPQLFDLQRDPGELQDVSAQFPEKIDQLAELLDRTRDSGRSAKCVIATNR